MKKLLKLTELSKREMAKIVGGMSVAVFDKLGNIECYCGCRYANQGGSSTGDNAAANNASGLQSPH